MPTEKQSIWKLVQYCAEDLTKRGMTPFTRGDLIRCIQRKNPHYKENSINPIIQGVTDDLRGGAPGAVGKDILHRVGRGLFVLKESAPNKQNYGKRRIKKKAEQAIASAHSSKDIIGGYIFQKICDIRPERNDSGSVSKFMPQDRYYNKQNLPLNKYGAGPFCKFKIPGNLNSCGVYAIIVNSETKYIGECQNLSSRYNMGYGNISPRNCFIGGQETNCRINNLILSEAKKGSLISLWFLDTEDYKLVEQKLRSSEEPEWNQV